MVEIAFSAAAGVSLGLTLCRRSRWFEFCLVSVLVLVGVSGLLERELRLPATATQPVQEAIVVAVVVAGLFGHWEGNRLPRQLGYLLVAWCVLVTLVVGELRIDIALQALRVSVLPIMVAVAVMRVPRVEPDLVIRAIVYGAIPGAVLATRQALVGFTAPELEVLTTAEATYIVGDSFRLIGAVGTGQEFAMMIMLAALCALWRLSSSDRRSLSDGILAAWYVVLVILCLQRIAVAALFVAVMYLMIAQRRRFKALRRVTIRVLPYVILAAIGSLILRLSRLSDVASRIGTFFSLGSDESLDARFEILWPRAFGLVVERPITGWGAGSAGVTSVRYEDQLTNGIVVADNMLLHFAVQYGIVGCAIALVFVLVLWRRASVPDGTLAKAVLLGSAAAGVTGTVLGLYGYMLQMGAVVAICATREPGVDLEPRSAEAEHVG